MTLYVSVRESQGWGSEQVFYSGQTAIRGEFSVFSEPLNQIQATLLTVSDAQEQKVVWASAWRSPVTFHPLSVGQLRRDAMLEVLNRLRTLKAELREKSGEFDIEEGLEEVRNER